MNFKVNSNYDFNTTTLIVLLVLLLCQYLFYFVCYCIDWEKDDRGISREKIDKWRFIGWGRNDGSTAWCKYLKFSHIIKSGSILFSFEFTSFTSRIKKYSRE